jgi:glutathione S-transferase
MKLYYMPGVCSLATHILLREAGLNFELERVGNDKKTETGANFLSVNPLGYVPALATDDGYVLTENVAVHSYVASLRPEANLAPAPGTRERFRYDSLAVFITTEIHKTYSGLFTSYPDEIKTQVREKLAKRYEQVEAMLSDGRPFVTGNSFQTVDAYFFTVTRWAPHVNFDLSKFPKVNAFMERVAARPAVKAALESEGLLKAA